MYQYLTQGEVLQPIATEVEAMISSLHKEIDEQIEANQFRVLRSFQNIELVILILFHQQVMAMMILVEIR